MSNFRNKLAAFMYGRYGADTLYWWSFGVIIVLCVARVIFSVFGFYRVAWILNTLSAVILVIAIFRFMSRNTDKRRAENRKFKKFIGIFKGKYVVAKAKYRDRKTHVFKKCPECKAVIRLPKRSGEHTVRCPKCNKRFEVKLK